MQLQKAQAEESQAASDPYLDTVLRYADTMIEHGRDGYGEIHSPLFAATLDRRTFKIPATQPESIAGIRGGDRTLTGANPMHDLHLYQVLYGLTQVTGKPRYAIAADETLQWFFQHCQSSATSLLAWGEHLGWDFATEGPLPDRDIHEFYRPWALWKRSIQLAPEACYKFAMGLWQHQIADQRTGEFSRHAHYIKYGPDKGHEFPRHGGFYIATWAAVFESSQDPELLRAIEVLVNSFQDRRDPQSGAIPSQSSIRELMWPSSNVSLAIDLWESANKVPIRLGDKMRACALEIDETFLKIKHDLSPAGKGFVKSAFTSTLAVYNPHTAKRQAPEGDQTTSYSATWATGYGLATDAQIALLCLARYQQAQIGSYKTLFLAAADRYLDTAPDTSITLYPETLGQAIATLLAAYQLTGDPKYFERANVCGQWALDIFFQDSPLPRASSKHDHYEAITGADTLVMSLLDLWLWQHHKEKLLAFEWR